MTPQEKQEFEQMKGLLARLVKSDRYFFDKTLQIADGKKIQLGVTTGTVIGTAITQKLGFFGAAPIAQNVALTYPTGGSTVDSQARASINQILNTLSESAGGFGLTA